MGNIFHSHGKKPRPIVVWLSQETQPEASKNTVEEREGKYGDTCLSTPLNTEQKENLNFTDYDSVDNKNNDGSGYD